MAKRLGDQAQVSILHGVDHFWVGSTERLVEKVQQFLERNVA